MGCRIGNPFFVIGRGKMLSIICNWIYMGLIVSVMGFALMQGYTSLMAKVDRQERRTDFGIGHVLLTGILGTTFYAQVFSLFYRVNMEANIVLIVLLVIYAIWKRKYIADMIFRWKKECSFSSKKRFAIYAVFFLAVIVFALSGAGDPKLIDTDWYHAQTIRWIEEYGCVRGVANLFYALGFNNAQHYFDALFSMVWVFGQSLKGTGGFFGLIIFVHGFLRVMQWKKHTSHIADMLAVWEVAYSIIVTAFFADPYVDTLPNVIVLFIMTEWLALLEEKKEYMVWFGFYCLLAVFAVICKTSVAMVVLLTVYAVYLLVKQKKARQIPLFLGMGFVMAVPYLITNVLTSGYLIYLLSAIDIFNVKWKIDPAVLQYSVDNMVAFARMPGASMEEALNCGLAWVPGWFAAESISHQVLYISIVGFIVYDLFQTGVCLLKKKDVDFAMLWPRICVYVGLVYWFFTIPQVKYCWSFLVFVTAVVPMYYWEKRRNALEDEQISVREMVFGKRYPLLVKGIMALSIMLLLLYTGFYSLRTLGYMKDNVLTYPVMQADYSNHVFNKVEKNGKTFFTRIDNGDIVCGYYIFPYLDNKEDLNRLVVGESLGDGFYFEGIK